MAPKRPRTIRRPPAIRSLSYTKSRDSARHTRRLVAQTRRMCRAGSALIAVLFSAAGCTSSHPSSRLPLNDLHASGIHLSPANSQATVSLSQAERIATHSHRRIEGIAYRHVTDLSRYPALDTDAWLVSLDPSVDSQAAGPPGSSPAPQAFVVDIIDGHSGDLLMQVSGSAQ